VSDTGTRTKVRELLADGTLHSKDRAVALLVRDGMGEQDAQRTAWGIASCDVASLKRPKGKIHLLRGRRTSKGVGGFWTYCGRHVFGEVTWGSPEGFVLRRLKLEGPPPLGTPEPDPPVRDHCSMCAKTTNRSGRKPWDSRVRQRKQAMGLKLLPYDCRRGDHWHLDTAGGQVCRYCDHSPMPLFGRA